MGVLTPFSWLYAAGAWARGAAFDARLLRSTHLGIPTLSVGESDSRRDREDPLHDVAPRAGGGAGVEAAVLTRGYGGDGKTNDEIEMVRGRFPKVGIGVGGDRIASARRLFAAKPTIGAFVLDDGFQHRRVARDLDILLVDATDPFGGGECLPGGRLREPKVGIRRAGVVVLTRVDQAERAAVEAIWGSSRNLGTGARGSRRRTSPSRSWRSGITRRRALRRGSAGGASACCRRSPGRIASSARFARSAVPSPSTAPSPITTDTCPPTSPISATATAKVGV